VEYDPSSQEKLKDTNNFHLKAAQTNYFGAGKHKSFTKE